VAHHESLIPRPRENEEVLSGQACASTPAFHLLKRLGRVLFRILGCNGAPGVFVPDGQFAESRDGKGLDRVDNDWGLTDDILLRIRDGRWKYEYMFALSDGCQPEPTMLRPSTMLAVVYLRGRTVMGREV